MNAAILLAVVIALSCIFQCEASFVPGSSDHDLIIFKDRIRVLYKLLHSKCPEIKQKREMNDALQQAELTVLREHYAAAMKTYIDCISKVTTAASTKPPITTSAPTKPPITTSTSTKPPITAAALTTVNRATTTTPKHWACLNATNFTESWRLDHAGSDIKPRVNQNVNDYACDRSPEVQWFRFTGAAGNKMLNKPPKPFSCGARVPMWTNATMPTVVGVPTKVPIFYVASSGPIYQLGTLDVVKCCAVTDSDFVYEAGLSKYSKWCDAAYCGMI